MNKTLEAYRDACKRLGASKMELDTLKSLTDVVSLYEGMRESFYAVVSKMGYNADEAGTAWVQMAPNELPTTSDEVFEQVNEALDKSE